MSGTAITASELLTADQVAELLGVTTSRVYALSRLWFESGHRRGVPTVPLGKKTYRYRREAVESWIVQLENGEAEA